MIISRIPPRRTFRLPSYDPFTVRCRPGLHVALLDVTGLARVVDDHLERATNLNRLRRLDIDVGETSRDGLRGHTIHSDFLCVQRQVEVERVEMLGGPRTNGRGPSDGLTTWIPVDHDLVLGHVVAAVAGLRIVRIAESRFSMSGVGILWRRRRHTARRLSLPSGYRPGQAERRRHHGQQDHRQDDREHVRRPVRPLHRWLLWRSLSWWGGYKGFWLGRRPPRVNARHAPEI